MTSTRWLDDEEMSAWRAWVLLAERVRAGIGRDLARDHGLSEAEYAVLVHLSEAPEHLLRMNDLAAGLDWSKSRLSHLVTRMEAKGLVTKRDCPSDARGSFAWLTEDGLAEITRAAPSHVASVRRHFLDHLDPEQIRQLGAIVSSALERTSPPAASTAVPTDYEDCDETEDAMGGCPGGGSAQLPAGPGGNQAGSPAG